MWYGHKPDVSKLRIFGSKAFCLVPKEKRNKLDSRSKICHFVGYGVNGYRLWDGRKIVVARDVVVEEVAWQQSNGGRSCTSNSEQQSVDCRRLAGPFGEVQARVQEPEVLQPDPQAEIEEEEALVDPMVDQEAEATRRSQRTRKPPARLNDYLCVVAYALNTECFVEDVPESIEELQKLEDWPEWKVAVKEELRSLAENDTWELVDLPKGRKVVDNKWVFRLKLNPDGTIQRRKARLVAKGFTQRYGFDYHETYSPVVKMSTVRMMLAFANQHNYAVHQMDVTAAFLNGTLSEDVYMRQPRGFEEGDKVCKLRKSLYGLKQASKSWNDRFNVFAERIGFRRSEEDTCLYVRNGKAGPVYLLLYVDDVLIITKDVQEIEVVKRLLQQEFKMQDLGEAEMFLGLRIERDMAAGTMKLSQQGYVEAVLKRFGMELCKPASTPMEAGLQLPKGSESGHLDKPYRELIGCLTYLMTTCRPDLSAAVAYFSQYQCNPTDEHWIHSKRILRYLSGTKSRGLVYKRMDVIDRQIVGFADANWATDVNDRRSVSGYLFRIYDATTSWTTRKQRTIALSSTEAECSALADCICEAIWICKLFEELKIRDQNPVEIYEDNQSAIAIAESEAPSKKLKHTAVKLEFIKECVAEQKVSVKYLPTGDQPADMLTKGLSPVAFKKHCINLGILE